MLTEKDLLLEVIYFSPVNSIWLISRDSWEGIGSIFKDQITLSSDLEWQIKIDDSNRAFLLNQINTYELCQKIVHMSIISEIGDVLFISYDHMITSLMAFDFPGKADLIIKYKASDLLLEGTP